MKRLVILVACAPVLILAANEDVPRVAILGQGSAAAFADVLNAALGQESAFALVERAELDRLAGESALNSLGATDRPIALARLAKATAFLFLTLDETDQQHPLLVMRLTQTSDARVLHGLVLPWLPKELETNSKFAVAQFVGPLKRLAAAGGATPLNVSLLGLRAAVDDPKLRSFETSLNLLLAHRLAAQPGMALTERWRLDDLVFERSLAVKDNPALAAGAMLVDGSFTGSGTQVELRLRLRNAESDAGSLFNVQGSTLDAMPLVEAIVGHIAKLDQNKRETQAWQPQQEARAFAELGTWMVKHWLAPQAAEAFESSIALGNNDPLTFAGRAQAYAMCAYPSDLNVRSSGNEPADKIKPDHFSFHLTSAIQAVSFAVDYLEANPGPPKSKAISISSLHYPSTLGCRVFHNALLALQAVHEAGGQLRHRDLVARLRMELHRLVDCMDATVEGCNDLNYLEKKARFAAYWCTTPQETLSYYHTILAPDLGKNIKTQSPSFKWSHYLRSVILGHGLNGPFLEAKTPNHWLSDASTGPHRLIEWNDPDPQSVTQRWRDFIALLRAAPSPVAQADGLGFEISSSLQLETRLRLLNESVELLWKNRSILAQEEGILMFDTLQPQFPNEKGEFMKAVIPYHSFLSLCRNLFEKESWVPDNWLMSLALFRRGFAKEVLSEDKMRDLLAAMTGYGKRIQGDARQSQRVAWAGKSYSEVFVDTCSELAAAWPQLANNPITSSPTNVKFKVTRYWNLFRQVPMDQELRRWRIQPVQQMWRNTDFLNTDGTRIWLSHEKAGILSFDPGTLQTEVFGIPPGESGDQVQQIVATANEICAASRHALWRFDRPSKQWAKLDVPDAPYSLGRNGDDVLVAFGAGSNAVKGGRAGAGVGHLTQSGVKWIVSTRRRPFEHELDAMDVQRMCGVFAGPGGGLWASLCEYGREANSNSFHGKIYALEASNLSKVQPKSWFEVFFCGDRTLLWETWNTGKIEDQRSRGIQAWCVRPSAAEPELLIRSETGFQLPANVQQRWQPSATLEKLPCDRYSSYLCPTMHGDELWMLYRYEGGNKQVLLIGMLPGRKDPVSIPLSFVFSEADRAAVPSGFYPSNSQGDVRFYTQKHGIISTDYALALCSSLDHGVWLIPWTEIHDWLAEHPQP